jgi:GNAT superfamily N-acetyltransferase
MTISIRRMTVQDIPASHKLVAQIYCGLEISELRRLFDEADRSDSHAVVVAADDGKVVAFCHLHVCSAREAVLQVIVVDEAAQGLGIGKRLMAAAEAWASVCGCREIILGPQVSRPSAYSFYRSLGYRTSPSSDAMRKPLGAAA